jgi:hypothetical protein
MSLRFLTLTMFLALGHIMLAQEAKPFLEKSAALFKLEPTPMTPAAPAALLIPDAHKPDLDFSISNIRGINHPGSAEKEAIKALKAGKALQKDKDPAPLLFEDAGDPESAAPVRLRHFEGNQYNNWFPPDNTIAISQSGFIVSIVNSNLRFLNESGALLLNQSLGTFFSNLGLTDFFYDPRVLYDPDQNKFIIVARHSNTPADNKVVVSFSKTENPTQGWWTYTFDGNFLGNNTWFDFPSIGVSGEDLFISGNLFNPNNTFNQAVILQIDKQPGFVGGNIAWEYFNNVTNGFGTSAFTVVPVSFGFQGSYGPGIYLVSTTSSGGNHAHLYDITGNVEDQQEIFAYQIATTFYAPAADANQQSTQKRLDVGDCRVVSAFYADGIIHYAHLIDIGGGYAGFRYNRMNVGMNSISFTNYGQQLLDHAYPAIAPIGAGPGAKSVVVAFARSSSGSFPECRAVSFDENMSPSASISVKTGESFINVNAENIQRWGDYSGISRKHGAPNPIVWMSGCYGKANNTYGTWIAELSLDPNASVEEAPKISESLVFPNPVYDEFTLEWELSEAAYLLIYLASADGATVRSLYRGRAKAGLNRLTLNKGPLSPGAYFLFIQDENRQTIQSKKIIVAQ